MLASLCTKKKVRVASIVAVALLATGVDVVAAAGIEVEPQCPTSISPGAPLKLELRLTNTTQTQIYNGVTYSTGTTYNIAKSGLIIHLGNFNVLGPFVIPLVDTLNPQQTVTTNGYLNVAFPATAIHGTFAHIGISVLDSANKTLGSGACVIEVK